MQCVPCINFESEGGKVLLYLASPEGASIVGTRGEIFVVWFSRAKESAFLDVFLFQIYYGEPQGNELFVEQRCNGARSNTLSKAETPFLTKIFFAQQKNGVAMAPRLRRSCKG